MDSPREFTIHPLIGEDGYFAIDDNFGESIFMADNETSIIIDLLTRYQQGQHDGSRHLLRDCDMTVEEVAKTYNIQPGTVRRTISKGWIKARKSGKTWLIKLSDVEKRWGHKLRNSMIAVMVCASMGCALLPSPTNDAPAKQKSHEKHEKHEIHLCFGCQKV